MALGQLGTEPAREQPGVRPARRDGRVHQPDVEGVASRSVEPNLCGVGGIHLGPTCEQCSPTSCCPSSCSTTRSCRMEVGQDLRELFIQEVLDHLEAIGRPGRNVCFIEPKYSGDGPDEQERCWPNTTTPARAEDPARRPGRAVLRDGEVWYDDTLVDIAYRDYEIRDLIALEAREWTSSPIRDAVPQNRMISSVGGDFDHKSCWEILTDPQFTQKYFNCRRTAGLSPARPLDARLSDRQTTLPDGEVGRSARIRPRRARAAGAEAEPFLRWRPGA